MKRLEIPAASRSKVGKGSARSTRRDGRVPAIIYGGQEEPTPVSVDKHQIEVELQHSESENMIVHLQLDGKSEPVLTLIRDTQHNPLSGDLEHLDFQRVSLNQSIRTTVPLHTSGTPNGVRNAGGIFEQVIREVHIECLPMDIPDEVVVDISGMDINDTLHISDIPKSDKFTILDEEERAVANVVSPDSLATAPAPAEGEELEEGAEGEAVEGEETKAEE